MKSRAGVFLLASVASCFAARAQTTGEDTLVVSPLSEANAENPVETAGARAAPGPDADIAARVREEFVSRRSAAAVDAEIGVEGGVVRLSGTTVDEASKAAATAYARQVAGVKGVDNRMTVAGTAVSVRSTAADRMNDAAITFRVKTALLFCRPIRALKTRVKTENGVVTLKGRVRDADEKDAVGKLVSELDGISAVDNRLTIAF